MKEQIYFSKNGMYWGRGSFYVQDSIFFEWMSRFIVVEEWIYWSERLYLLVWKEGFIGVNSVYLLEQAS